MAVDNATILDRVRLVATNDYQQRIPATTQGGIASTMRALFNPLNREYWNQFIDILINRIGMTIVRGDQWDNPLAAFKGARLDYGSTIQEIAPGWIRAHSYDDASESLLKLERPEAQAWYHSQNRRDKYKLSINEQELRTAFTDDYGLNNFVTKLMQTIYNSDNYDEYRIMMQLVAEYENNWGFFKQRISAYDDATFDNKKFNEELLTQIQAYAGILRFPAALYNAQDVDIPVFANPDELILMITTRTLAGLNVQTLANVFNLELAEIKYRTVIVDEFPIPNCDAILTTRDFFVCHDTLYQTDSFYNPDTLANTYFLHHWGVYSVSPFVPAICFGDFETTGVDSLTYGIDASDSIISYLWYKWQSSSNYEVNPGLEALGTNPNNWNSIDVKNAISYKAVQAIPNAVLNLSYGGSAQLAMIVSGSLVGTLGGSEFEGTNTGTGITNVVGAGCNWKIEPILNYQPQGANMPEDLPYNWINSATYIDMYGKLHIQKTKPMNLPSATAVPKLDVTCEYSYINPSGETETVSNTVRINVVVD